MSFKFVFDTNALISAALIKNSTNSEALNRALNLGILAVSKSTLQELADVIFRKKFDRYFPNETERQDTLVNIEINSIIFHPSIIINDCRDPKDNKYLELAIVSNASCIISGDKDLLVLHPYKSIPIYSASEFLKNF